MAKYFVFGTLCVALLQGSARYRADDKPAHNVEQVMKIAHKGKPSLFGRVLKGEASKEEQEKLLHLYEDLAKNKPPKGSEEDWKKRTEALVSATQDFVENKPGAKQELQKAVNCKACHDSHRPEE